MAKEKKKLNEKEMTSKLKELKIELLKQPQKRKAIKKEIARLLTMAKQIKQTKLEDNAK
jgi:ribosomal protein L29